MSTGDWLPSRGIDHKNPVQDMQLFVKTLTGKTITAGAFRNAVVHPIAIVLPPTTFFEREDELLNAVQHFRSDPQLTIEVFGSNGSRWFFLGLFLVIWLS